MQIEVGTTEGLFFFFSILLENLLGCALAFHGGVLKLIATLVPFFSRVPIARYHKSNATHSSQDIYHCHYIRQRGGPLLLLHPSAAGFRSSNSLPTRAPGRRRRRFPHSYSLEKSHRLQIQPTSQSIFAKSLTKVSLSRPLLPPGPPAIATKCPSLLPGLARRNAG